MIHVYFQRSRFLIVVKIWVAFLLVVLASVHGIYSTNASKATQRRNLLHENYDTHLESEDSEEWEQCSRSCRYGCCDNGMVCCKKHFNVTSPFNIAAVILSFLGSLFMIVQVFKMLSSRARHRRQTQEEGNLEAGEMEVKDQQATAYLVENPDGQAHVAFCEEPNNPFESPDGPLDPVQVNNFFPDEAS